VSRVALDNGFNTFVAAISASEAPLPEQALTAFLPTDAAFDAVPDDIVRTLLTDQELLNTVLSYHLVDGAVRSGDLSSAGVPTLNGSNLAVRIDGATPTVNNAGITVVDLEAGECVLHGVDAVLIPPSLLSTLGFASINAAVSGAPIAFVDGTADFTDADSATLTAICNLVANETSTSGVPAVDWQSSGDASLDEARAAAIEQALASCGDGGLVVNPLAPTPSFTG